MASDEKKWDTNIPKSQSERPVAEKKGQARRRVPMLASFLIRMKTLFSAENN
jgi:hypothetical protein